MNNTNEKITKSMEWIVSKYNDTTLDDIVYSICDNVEPKESEDFCDGHDLYDKHGNMDMRVLFYVSERMVELEEEGKLVSLGEDCRCYDSYEVLEYLKGYINKRDKEANNE